LAHGTPVKWTVNHEGEKDTQGARNRHSDKEKFCNDLNGPKTRKMSEWPLKTLQDFPTSKLNTRVRFPSPAPSPRREYHCRIGVSAGGRSPSRAPKVMRPLFQRRIDDIFADMIALVKAIEDTLAKNNTDGL
jgi:hypothetical protein